MQFVFDERKAAQAAAWLLRRQGGPMSYIKLVKLLYLADRQALIETGVPITRDRFISTVHGPALGRILDLITWGRGDEPSPWHEHVSLPSNYCVMAIGSCDLPHLPEYARELLGNVQDEFGALDWLELVEETKGLPEWVEPDGCTTDIDARVILRDGGYSAEQIRIAEDDAADLYLVQSRFSAAG